MTCFSLRFELTTLGSNFCRNPPIPGGSNWRPRTARTCHTLHDDTPIPGKLA